MIIARAPLRMSFVGGGSDLPSFYSKKNGAILSATINKFVYITINKKFDNDIRLSYSITENVKKVNQIKHPIVRNTLKFLDIKGGIEINSISDIPSLGSGLGSSSSFTVALLHALCTYVGQKTSKEQLAKWASHIEINLCGTPIGKQDQYAAAYGGLNLIEFKKDHSVKVNPIKINNFDINKLEKSVIAFYTGYTRKATKLLKVQSENMKQKKKFEMTARMASLAYEMRNSIKNSDIIKAGNLVHENWELKRQLAKNVSNPLFDKWYQMGLNAGAIGGKILGAGNGGFMIFIANKNKLSKIEKSLSKLRRINFLFEKEGSKIIFKNSPK